MSEQRPKAERDLALAIKRGNLEATRLLLQEGVSANCRNVQGDPMLVLAVDRQYSQIVQLLLDHGADVRLKGEFGTALERAVLKPSVEITRMLAARGACIDELTESPGMRGVNTVDAKRQKLIERSLEAGQLGQVGYLQELGYVPDIERYGHEWLDECFDRWQNDETARFLIRSGARPSASHWRQPQRRALLEACGLKAPQKYAGPKSTAFKPRSMNEQHPLWPIRVALDLRGEAADVRAAKPEELDSIADFHVHSSVLEFLAHFMPTDDAWPYPSGLLPFNEIIRANVEAGPSRAGYLIIVETGEGDAICFGREPEPGGATPPIVRFSHELDYEGMTRDEVDRLGQRLARDAVEFFAHNA